PPDDARRERQADPAGRLHADLGRGRGRRCGGRERVRQRRRRPELAAEGPGPFVPAGLPAGQQEAPGPVLGLRRAGGGRDADCDLEVERDARGRGQPDLQGQPQEQHHRERVLRRERRHQGWSRRDLPDQGRKEHRLHGHPAAGVARQGRVAPTPRRSSRRGGREPSPSLSCEYHAAQGEGGYSMTVEPELRPDPTALGVDIRTVLDRLGDGITVQSPSGELLYANAAGAKLCGFESLEELLRATPDEVLARFQLFDERGAPFPISALPGRVVLQGGEPAEVLVRVRERESGATRWSLVQAFAVRDDAGEIAYVVNLFRDVTDRTDAAVRARLLNDVAGVLAEATDEASAVDSILERVCETLTWDVGVLWRVDDDGATVRFDRLWRRPETEIVAFERWLHGRTFTRGVGLAGRVWAAPAIEWVADVAAAPDLPGGPPAAQSGLHSVLAFPLLLAGGAVGVVQLLSREARPREERLDATLIAIGSQLGLFLERMRAQRERERLLWSEQAARSAAEEVAHTLGKLEEVTEAALRHVASGDVLQELLVQIARLVEADTSAILLLDDERRFLTVRAAVGLDRELEHAVPIPYGEGMAGRVASTRTPVVIRDLDQVELASPHLRERGIKSLVAIPITIGDQVIGVAHAGSVEQAHFDEADMRLLRLMADRLALAISQAQLYEDERAARRDAEVAHSRLAFLAEASTLLASSLDYESTLRAVARLAVPHLADWCVIDVVDDGKLTRIATAHADPEKLPLVDRLDSRWPERGDEPLGAHTVLRSGTPELFPEVSDDLLRSIARDEEHLAVLTELGMRSSMIVPMWGRDHVLGVLSFATAESGRSYAEADLALAEELARRAAVAVDNALLFRQAEEQARAARVLAAVGDGVFLVDARGMVSLWNPAAEAITGLGADAVLGREVADAIPGWLEIAPRVPVVEEHERAAARAETVPLEVGGRELWLSMSGVGFADGTVYAFRDLTQERVL